MGVGVLVLGYSALCKLTHEGLHSKDLAPCVMFTLGLMAAVQVKLTVLSFKSKRTCIKVHNIHIVFIFIPVTFNNDFCDKCIICVTNYIRKTLLA